MHFKFGVGDLLPVRRDELSALRSDAFGIITADTLLPAAGQHEPALVPGPARTVLAAAARDYGTSADTALKVTDAIISTGGACDVGPTCHCRADAVPALHALSLIGRMRPMCR